MIYVGIDPGKSGGIAALGDKGELLCAIPIPLIGKEIDPHNIAASLHSIFYEEPGGVFIEKSQSMPRQGISSAFNYGTGFGMLIGICAAMAYPMMLVSPRIWQKEMHKGADSSADPKDRSLQVVLRLFPKADLLATPRCKKPHDGIVDAILIAEYARRSLTVKDS